MSRSEIRDASLAPQGEVKITWAAAHMPVLHALHQEFSAKQPFRGQRVVMCLHLEAKTAYLARTVQAGGAEVVVAASNPLSTQDDVVAALVAGGVEAHAWYGATDAEYQGHLEAALAVQPTLLVDDGGDLVALLHGDCSSMRGQVAGGCEETTTGVQRLTAMDREGVLTFPMLAVNNALSKHLFDNRYGTGQSVWDGIMRSTNLVVAGKTAVVVGYGWCGKGVAMRARGLGARVIVCEVDAIRANEALMDGYRVMPLLEAAREADFLITVTGNNRVVRREHLEAMPDGAILANAGHFDVEIAKDDLAGLARERRKARENVEEYLLPDGRRLYLLAEGRLVNLAAGDGHPAEIMDMSFALQAQSLRHLLEEGRQLPAGVHPVPEALDRDVAARRLQALGVRLDSLNQQQVEYLAGWRG